MFVSLLGPVLVITEYCSLGDLLNFLRQKAEMFMNFVMNGPDITENANDYKNICNRMRFMRRYASHVLDGGFMANLRSLAFLR